MNLCGTANIGNYNYMALQFWTCPKAPRCGVLGELDWKYVTRDGKVAEKTANIYLGGSPTANIAIWGTSPKIVTFGRKAIHTKHIS